VVEEVSGMAGEFDISENTERLRFDFESYCLNRAVVGLVARRDRVEFYLEGNRMIAFSVHGPDIMIEIAVPDRPLIEPGRVQ
jgi:hypothetical protein